MKRTEEGVVKSLGLIRELEAERWGGAQVTRVIDASDRRDRVVAPVVQSRSMIVRES